ncbi:hypothetical protein CERZMDRAFT_83116 [Cercospora zeae-maydis SCOH1-5]|uniref:Lysine-specific metallo-endopeptidase domain-containing protein n=1 Tax=Cercospora zeae-maydis SCOH1-5 TaxID=717836 RepID=A0A6A6FLZ9_9PEZI|nr:hypothetical protein CERZMDRAFT_83116 [Cercospora zeae-maydis SCOH1-5]
MHSIHKILLIGATATLSAGSPVQLGNADAATANEGKNVIQARQDLPEILNFDGIDWAQTEDLGKCSRDQMGILMETAKNIYDWYGMAPLAVERTDDEDPVWQRWFGGRIEQGIPQPRYTWFGDHDARSPVERQWLKQIDSTYQHILSSLRSARDYPMMGNAKPSKKNRRVTFLCQSAERLPGHCKSNSRLPAYTTQNDADWPNSGFGYTISFCDTFFSEDRVFARDLVNSKPTYTLSKLETFEHILYHEYMHVKWFGHPYKIVDLTESLLVTDDFDQLIYGANACSAFARKLYAKEANSSVNPLTGINADNYAWYATNKILREAWGAKDDPFNYLDRDDYPQLSSPKRRRSAQAAEPEILARSLMNVARDDADQNEAIEDLQKWPRNCIWTLEEEDNMCELLRDDYDDWVAEELGTTLSAECQQVDPNKPFFELNAVHPDCKCTDDKTGDDVRLYEIGRCKGFVGVALGCRDADDGGCDCRTNLNNGPQHISKSDKGDQACKSFSRGGMTEQDIDDLIATGG